MRKAFVRRLLHQRMIEAVAALLRFVGGKHQAGVEQPAQGRAQRVLVHAGDRRQQRDRRNGVRSPKRPARSPWRRPGGPAGPSANPAASRAPRRSARFACSIDRLGELFDVAAARRRCGSRSAAPALRRSACRRLRVGSWRRIVRDPMACTTITVACARSPQGLRELRPVGDQDQDALSVSMRASTRSIRLCVVGSLQWASSSNSSTGTPSGAASRKSSSMASVSAAALRRCQLHRRQALRHGKLQQLGDQQQVPARRPADAREQGLDAPQILVGGLIRLNRRLVPQQLDDRMQRAVAVIGRALTAQQPMRLRREPARPVPRAGATCPSRLHR